MKLTDQTSDRQPTGTRKPYVAPKLVCYGNVTDVIQGGGGGGKDADGQNTKTCWVAEALYGAHDPRTTLLRAWVSQVYVQRRRGWWFAALYVRFGRRVANLIHLGYLPPQFLRPLFDSLVVRAFEASAHSIRAVDH